MPANGLHQSPTLTTVHDTIYIAANVFPIDGTVVGVRPIYLARIPGGPIPAPAGDFQFVYPKIAAGKNGDVHLIWAEFDSTRHDVFSWGRNARTLWHSVFRTGAWSSAREILKADWLEWPSDVGSVSVDGSGVLHVLVWTSSPSFSGLVHLSETSRGWRADRTPHAVQPPPKSAIHASGDTVVVAFPGATISISDTSWVIVSASTNGGATWTSTRVHPLRGRSVFNMQLIRSGDHLYLAWAEGPQRSFSRDTLRIVRLVDSQRPVPVAAVSLVAGASTVALTAPCGNLAFLVETFSQQPRTFAGTITANGVVSLQHSLRPPNELALFTGIGATSRSVVAVLAIRGAPGTRGRAVMMSRPACSTAHDR